MAGEPQQGNVYERFGNPSRDISQLKSPKNTKGKDVAELYKLLSEISTGMRILEDRYNNLRKKVQLTDQALIEAERNFSKEKRLLEEELVETKMKLQEFIDDMKIMKGELQSAVKQNDIQILEKYLDMWEPMEFVTRKEVDELLESKFPNKFKKNKTDSIG